MKRITLRSRGQHHAIVDDEDYPTVLRYKWYLHNGYAHTTYHRIGCGRADRDRNINLSMSKLIAGMCGLLTPERIYVDHINGDRLDNRRSNLRAVTLQENNWNLARHRYGVKGVRKTGYGTYQVRLGRTVYGNYADEDLAKLVYNKVARALRGDFACLFDVDGELPDNLEIPNFTKPAGAEHRSGVAGVVWFKPRSCWRVIVKQKTLGYFTNLNEAIKFRRSL